MIKKLVIAAGVSGLLATSAYAVTESVTANIDFDSALTITKIADIDFGTVLAGVADTYTIDTTGAVTAAGSGAQVAGTPAAGNLTIAGSATQAIDVSVSGYTADSGVTPQNATCAYDGGVEGACSLTAAAAPGVGKTLLLGVEAVVDGTQAAGSSAAPTFDVNVVYN